MRLPKSRLARVAGSLVVVGAVAGITLGVTTLLGVTFGGEAEPEPVEGALSGRGPGLAICVQAVEIDAAGQAAAGDSALEAAGKSAIEAALIEVAKHPNWEVSGRAAFLPMIDTGCPSLPTEPVIAEARSPIGFIEGHRVSKPSPYEVFVFILPPEQLEVLVGTSMREPLVRRAPQELICNEKLESGCRGVTTGLYLTPDELNDKTFLARALEIVLGLGERP